MLLQTRYRGYRQNWRVFLLVAFVATCAGCAKSSSPVAPVKGKVLIEGQPLPDGFVVTLPEAGPGARGIIQNGEFELSTFGKNDGAVIGTHRIGVSRLEKSQSGGAESPAGKSLIPERYANPQASGLSLEVKSGELNSPTFELTSK